MTKIIVVSKGEVMRCHTLRLLTEAGIPHTVVVHDKESADRLKKEKLLGKIVVSNTTGIVAQRNWALDKLVKKREWFIGMDDNIQYFTCVKPAFRKKPKNITSEPPPGKQTWRQIYNVKVEPAEWIAELEKNMQLADTVGAPFIGVATMENPFFRVTRHSNFRFVKTKVYAMKAHPDLRFKYEYAQDSYLTALVLTKYGRVLVDSFMHYKAKMYESGGLGDRAHREQNGLLTDLNNIVAEFPGLVSLAKGKNSALRVNLTSAASVDRWRAGRESI